MADEITKVKGAPFICIMGAPKIGKTRLAATFPDNFFLDTESGAGSATDPDHIVQINPIKDEKFLTTTKTYIKELINSPYDPKTKRLTYKHDGKAIQVGAVTLDTIDGLQDPLKYSIMSRNGHATMIDRDWGLLLDYLYPVFMSMTGIPVPKIVVCHTKAIDPMEENLGSRTFSAQGALATKMPRWFDVIIHLVSTDYKGTRVAYVQPAIVSKYQILAGDRHDIFKTLGPSFPVPLEAGRPSKQIAELIRNSFDY